MLFNIFKNPKTMRYVIKWNNGFWKIFDVIRFEDCEKFNTRMEAEEKLNA